MLEVVYATILWFNDSSKRYEDQFFLAILGVMEVYDLFWKIFKIQTETQKTTKKLKKLRRLFLPQKTVKVTVPSV